MSSITQGVVASPAPYIRLAKLLMRSFYSGQCPPLSWRDPNDLEGSRNRVGKVDTTGLGIILMDFLLSKEWVPEEEIVESIKVHPKLIRRALKYLEKEQLLMSEHRRETRRGQKRDVVKAVLNANAEAEKVAGEDDEDVIELLERPHTISYYAVDFPRLFDVVQLRLHNMKKALKDELDSKEVLAKYKCSNEHCGKEYSSFEAHWLVQDDGEMRCNMCIDQHLVKPVLASGKMGDDAARRQRRMGYTSEDNERSLLQMIASRLTRIDTQLHETLQLVAVLRLSTAPFYGTLTDWARLNQAIIQQQQHQQQQQQQQGGGRGGYGGSRLPGQLLASGNSGYWQDTQVEIRIAGSESNAGGTSAGGVLGRTTAPAPENKPAILPPWMLRATGLTSGGGPSGGPGMGAAQEETSDKKALVSAEEEARKAAYVAQYSALLARAQAEKREKILQSSLVASGSSFGSGSRSEPAPKRPRHEEQPPEVSKQRELEDGGEGLMEWEDGGLDSQAMPADLPAASPPPNASNREPTPDIAGDLDWEDIL